MWIYKIDRDGRRDDTSLGFVAGSNRVLTAFQAVDSTQELEVEFANGRRIRTGELAACSRTGDWAVLQVDTSGVPALEAGDPKGVAVGERLIAFNVESGGRIIGGVDIRAAAPSRSLANAFKSRPDWPRKPPAARCWMFGVASSESWAAAPRRGPAMAVTTLPSVQLYPTA